MTTSVTVLGGSGYTGLELVRLVQQHPGVKLEAVSSDRWVGQAVSGSDALKYLSHDEAIKRASGLAFLATPAEVSLKLAPALLERGVKVIDLSGAFRLKDAKQYARYYGFEHPWPDLLSEAVYGLPEVSRSKGRLIANPGCYATAAALALYPLLKARAVDPKTIVVTAASGVSGAGRKATEDFSFMEIEGDFRAYKTLKHQHTPEIAQTLGISGLVFVPHLLPIARGILCTAVAKASVDPGPLFRDAYGQEPFIRLQASADAVRVAQAARTPYCDLGVSFDGENVVVTAAIDNLLKGAASQAVQNMNLVLGFPEGEGLLKS